LEKLRDANLLEKFISDRQMRPATRQIFANLLDLPHDEIRTFQFSIARRLSAFSDEDLFSTPRANIERQLSEFLPDRALYLPTYRRIEKDLKDIFPDMEDRGRSSAAAGGNYKFTRSAKHYIDLVSFGMEDVRLNIDAKTRHIRDYSLSQFNDLSGLYLRDVIKGSADQYSPSQISRLDESSLNAILGRVNEEVLSGSEKSLLKTKIMDIKTKKRKDLEVNDLYLAHYFVRLMSVSEDITNQEIDISEFVDVCNKYLSPGKQIVYDDTKFTVNIVDDRGKEIDISLLSSGEKQIVSVFSHLYLDDARAQIVIIDEPELSLSVPWQQTFLPDILKSGHCGFIMSVTHSPFIYQNYLQEFAVDLRRKTSIEQ
jgi:hypothetical protein